MELSQVGKRSWTTTIRSCGRPVHRCRRSMRGSHLKRETLPVRVTTDRYAGRGRHCACRPQEDHAIDLSRPARPSTGRRHPKADARRFHALLIRGQRRQGRCISFSQCAAAHRDHEQPRRREESCHSSDDDHTSATHTGAACRARHRRRIDQVFGRTRTPGRSDRRSSDSDGESVRAEIAQGTTCDKAVADITGRCAASAMAFPSPFAMQA